MNFREIEASSYIFTMQANFPLEIEKNTMQKKKMSLQGQGCSSMAERLPIMHKPLSSSLCPMHTPKKYASLFYLTQDFLGQILTMITSVCICYTLENLLHRRKLFLIHLLIHKNVNNVQDKISIKKKSQYIELDLLCNLEKNISFPFSKMSELE